MIDPGKLDYYNEDCNWPLKRKYSGGRMNLKELTEYLGYKFQEECYKKWILGRDLYHIISRKR